METLRNTKKYKYLCDKLNIDLINHIKWCKQKEFEYAQKNGWQEDDRPSDEIDRDIYGKDYIDVFADLNEDELLYIDKIYRLVKVDIK